MHKFRYFNNCVAWEQHEVDSLIECVENNRNITAQTFRKNVNLNDLKQLEKSLGYADHYSQGLLLSQDYAVSYHKSKYKGETVYYISYSMIEYVFTTETF